MPRFAYTCIDLSRGREVSGHIDSLTREQAVLLLKSRGLQPIALRLAVSVPGPAPAPSGPRNPKAAFRGGKVERKALTHFTRQLASLVKAGMPLLRSLEVLSRQARGTRLRSLLAALADDVRGGDSLSDAIARHPRVFPPLYVAMVRAGEAGGVLEVVLERLGRFLDKSDKLRGRVKAALVYPLMIVLVAGGVVGALMMLVVPKFEVVFASLMKGQRLPALTEAVLTVGHFVRAHAVPLLLLGLLVAAAWCMFARLPAVRGQWDRLVLAVPGLGGLILKSAVARLTRTLGTLLAAGVPMLPALLIARETGGNVRIADALTTVHDRVMAGDPVATPLAATGVFPELVPSMVEVGEETGALPEMLARIADTYDEEVDTAVAGLTSLIEPVTIALMAVVVGTIVIAMFLPIVRIIQTLS